MSFFWPLCRWLINYNDIEDIEAAASLSMFTTGNVIYTAFKPIIKIYFIIATGYLLSRMNILTLDTGRNLSNMIMTAFLPCLVFNKVITNIQSSDIKAIGIIGLNAALLFTIGGLGGFIVGKVTGAPHRWMGGITSVGLFPNISDLPIAYVQSMATGTVFTKEQGDKGVAYVCVYLAFYIIVQFNMGGYKLIERDFRKPSPSLENELSEGSEENTGKKLEDGLREEPGENTGRDLGDEPCRYDWVYPNPTVESRRGEEPLLGEKTPSCSYRILEPLRSLNDVSLLSTGASRAENSGSLVLGAHSCGAAPRSQPRVSTSSRQSILNEYSEVERLRTNPNLTPTVRGMNDISVGSLSPPFARVPPFLHTLLENFKKPTSVSLIISITFAMIPWVKALFVESNQVTLPSAPDGNPPLSFLMDFTAYIGAASVPLGLLLIGATLSRLTVRSKPPGFALTAACITIFRLVAMPVIGCLINWGLAEAGFFKGDDMLRFISIINWGLPSATTLVFFTAFYSDPDGENIQMDCLSIVMLCQYPLLAVTLPTLVSYTLKKIMGY